MPRVHLALLLLVGLSLPLTGATASPLASALALPLGSVAAIADEPPATDPVHVATSAEDSLAVRPGAPAGWPGLARGDRLQHASLSFTLAAGLTVACRDRGAAAGLTLGLGIVKELWDSRHGGADLVDLVADVVGTGAALLMVRAGTSRDP